MLQSPPLLQNHVATRVKSRPPAMAQRCAGCCLSLQAHLPFPLVHAGHSPTIHTSLGSLNTPGLFPVSGTLPLMIFCLEYRSLRSALSCLLIGIQASTLALRHASCLYCPGCHSSPPSFLTPPHLCEPLQYSSCVFFLLLPGLELIALTYMLGGLFPGFTTR